MAPPPPPRAPPPRPNDVPPPKPDGAPPRPAGAPPTRPAGAPPPRPTGSSQPSEGSQSADTIPKPVGIPPPPKPSGVPPPPRAPGPPTDKSTPTSVPPRPNIPPPRPNGTIPGPPPGGPPKAPSEPVPGPPSGPPPRPPGGPPSTSPTKKKGGLPGPPPGAPPGPPPGPPPLPPKEPLPIPVEKPAEDDPDTKARKEAIAAGGIEKLLRTGRLNFKLIEARGLKKKGSTEKKFSADPYIKICIGRHAQMEHKSKTLKKCTSTILFHEEVISFDLVKPTTLVDDGDVSIHLELYDENIISDELIGDVSFSALRYFDGGVHHEVLPLSLSGSGPCGELEVEIQMDIALVGMLSIILLEGRNLKSMELIGKQDPYVKLGIGTYTKRGKTVQKGGRNPYFSEEELVFWITDDIWIHPMKLQIYDEDIGSDDLIGETHFNILHFMKTLGSQEHIIPLKNNGNSAGEIVCRFEFFPAGTMVLQCYAGRQLRSVDAIGRQDPYVKFTIEGKATKSIMKTKTDQDGGNEPEWEDAIYTFDIVDQYTILIEVFDEDSVGNDSLIGQANVSLLPLFRYGYLDDWLNLWYKGKFGSKEPAGQLHLEMSFNGPKGIAFPQHQLGMDHFNDKERRTKETAHLTKEEFMATQVSPDEPKVEKTISKSTTKVETINESEFSEEEILNAFRFIDLDKNNFIGAAELRHLLICMGELITDEEVDAMIKLCDTDGDGQVSFIEFRRMVIHPDPASPEFTLSNPEEEEVDIRVVTKEVTPEEKTRQLEIKEEKKKLLKRFVQDTTMTLDLLTRIAAKYHAMHTDTIDFEDFCGLFEIEPTGEYRRLHTLYMLHDDDDGIDMKEMLLGMVNFIQHIDRQQRVKFCFEIFDDDHNGVLTMNELVAILKANHMASTPAQVQKKAETIMKQADDNGDQKISLDEFYAIAKKFPNLLFPPSEANT